MNSIQGSVVDPEINTKEGGGTLTNALLIQSFNFKFQISKISFDYIFNA